MPHARSRFRRILVEQLEDRSLLAATITVNSTFDTNARDSALTLREAILINNRTLAVAALTAAEQSQVSGSPTSADTDTIAFNIPGSGVQTITPTSSLPSLLDSVVVDGYTQPGAMPNSDSNGFNGTLLIELKHVSTVGLGSILQVSASHSLIRGLVINGFGSADAISVNASNCVIQGNSLGTNAAGTASVPNRYGVNISGGSGTLVGGSEPAQRNLISGNVSAGIRLTSTSSVQNTVIRGNFIGTDASGSLAIGNGYGIAVFVNVTGTIIGGPGIGDGNLISGNTKGGIELGGGQITCSSSEQLGNSSTGNVVQGNKIGTDKSGTQPLGNIRNGISVGFTTLSANTIGGTGTGEGNIIAFNSLNGVGIMTSQAAINSNSIFSNGQLGIHLGILGCTATPNDPGDADSGPNNRQNFPVISLAAVSGTTVNLQYAVPSTIAASAYPLRVEFFRADSDGQEGQTFLGFNSYTAAEAGTTKTFSFTPAASIANGMKLVATATDSAGNTSEFSTNVTVQSAACSTVVVNTNDSGAGSLRDAINCANNTPDADTITFGSVFLDTTPDVIRLTSGELAVESDLTIQGPGASFLKVSGNSASRVLRVAAETTATVTGLTIADGNGVGGGIGPIGGGIYNEGALTLRNIVVSSNRTRGVGGSFDSGGGIQNTKGTVILVQSTVDNNFAYGTGGGINNDGGSVTLVNSTVSNNSCGAGAGGIGNFNNGTLTIHNSTISANISPLFGGGIANSSGTLVITNSTITGNRGGGRGGISTSSRTTMLNSIVAGNFNGGASPSPGPADIESGTIDTAFNNLIGDARTSGNLVHDADDNPATGSNNIVGNSGIGTIPINTVIGPLADNGGPTRTHVLVPGSRAIDTGNNAHALDVQNQPLITDQRGAGFPRFANIVVDIGAVEAGVTPFNDPPSGDDRTISLFEDTTHIFTAADFGFTDLLDAPPNAFVAARIASRPAAGTLTVAGVPAVAGQVILATSVAAGEVRFTPPANTRIFQTSFAFQVQDDGGTTNGGIDLDLTPNTITLNVIGVNDPPSGISRTLGLMQNAVHIFSASDFGFSDLQDFHTLLAVRITTIPTAGSLTASGNSVAVGQFIPLATIDSGAIRFTPPPNASGTPLASFTFQVQDNGGTANGGIDLDSTPNTITFNVTAVNDPPSGTDRTVSFPEDTVYIFSSGEFGFTDSLDTPANGLAGVKLGVLPAVGKLLSRGVEVASGQVVPAADLLTGQLLYIPPADASGSPLTSFTFQVQDNGGTANGGIDLDPTPNTMTINVTPVNDPPAAANDSASIGENGLLAVPASGVLDNDTDLDAGDTKMVVTVNGNAADVGAPVDLPSGARVRVLADGSYRYNPNGQFESLAGGQTATDSFTYQMADSQGARATATVTITILGENDAPNAGDDSFATAEDTPLVIAPRGVLANDTDVDSAFLTAVPVAQPSRGTLTLALDGSFRYVPLRDYHGPDSFTYQVSDGLTTSVATVSLTVTPVHDRPVVVLDANLAALEGTALIAAGAFSDPDSGDAWTATVDYGAGGGVQPLALNADKTFGLSHVYADNGTYTITVNVRDATGLVGLGTTNVVVANVTPRGLSLSGPQNGLRGQPLAFRGGFADPGPVDTFMVTLDFGDGATAPAQVTRSGSGWQFSAEHVFAASGTFQVRVQVQDDDGGLATQSVTVTINTPAVGAALRNGVLEITGSPQRDNIALTRSGSKIIVNATYGQTNSNVSFALASVQRIVADLGAGDDALKVDAQIRVPLLVQAGAGNDRVTAGGGPATIAGGDGNDLLYGGNSGDVLIGGAGRDQLWGYGGSDLLIAGRSSHDGNLAALAAVLAEWTSARPLATRRSNLSTGSGPVLAGTGILLKQNETLFDDSDVDLVMGGGDIDWFLFDVKKDGSKDKATAEPLN